MTVTQMSKKLENMPMMDDMIRTEVFLSTP
jgi:hypothetical protein